MTAKRFVDLALSIPGLIVLLPLMVVLAIWVRLDSPGPSLFRQRRVGRGGRCFDILKFRTMVTDAESAGGPLTVGGDRRVTRAGRLLRRYKLDELPQLWNVVRGEMSLVGPRPEVPKYVALYDAAQRRVLELVPGITDPASIEFIDEERVLAAAVDAERCYTETLLPRKIELNLEYSQRATCWSDLVVIGQTVAGLWRRRA